MTQEKIQPSPMPTTYPSARKGTACLMLALSLVTDATQAQESVKIDADAAYSSVVRFFSKLFGSPGAELRELLDKEHLDDALKLYLSKQPELDATQDALPLVEKLAERLNQRTAPELSEMTLKLQSIDLSPERNLTEASPLPARKREAVKPRDHDSRFPRQDRPSTAHQWEAWSSWLKDAQWLQARHKENPLLERFKSTETLKLESAYLASRQRLAQNMPAQLIGHDLAASPDFFSSYPLPTNEVDRRQLLREQTPALVRAISKYDTSRATQALITYLPLVTTPDVRQQWTQAWINAYSRERKWSSKLTQAQKKEAEHRLAEAIPQTSADTIAVGLPASRLDLVMEKSPPAHASSAIPIERFKEAPHASPQSPQQAAAKTELPKPASASSKSPENTLGGAPGELRELIDRGNIDDALMLYASKQAELDASPQTQILIEKLAGLWNRRSAPLLNALSAQMKLIGVSTDSLQADVKKHQRIKHKALRPADTSLRTAEATTASKSAQWEAWSRILGDAEKLQEQSKGNPLYERFKSVEARTLESAHRDARERIARGVPSQLVAYDLAARPDFFSAYPWPSTDADRQRLVTEHTPSLVKAISTYSSARATQALTQYLPLVTTLEGRQQWIRGWMDAYALERKWGRPLTLAQKKEVGQRLMEAVPGTNARLTVAIVPIFASDVPLDRRGHAHRRAKMLSESLGAELQQDTEYGQIMERLATLRASHDAVILADIGRLKGIEKIVSKSTQTAQFLSREDTTPNPERQRLSVELQQAQYNLQRQEAEQRRTRDQALNIAKQSQGMAVVGLLTATASIFDSGEARAEVNRLRDALRQVPTTVSKPVYQKYELSVLKLRITALAPISLYLVDMAQNTVKLSNYPYSQTLEYVVPENRHPADPDAHSIMAIDMEREAQRNEIVQRALTSVPQDPPNLDRLIESMEIESKPTSHIHHLLTEDNLRLSREADLIKFGTK